MGSFSDYLENKALDHIFAGTAYATPTHWVALFADDVGEAGSTGEISTTTGYTRIQSTSWTAASSGYTYNSASITFSTATSSYTVNYFGVFDSSAAGNFLGGSSLTASKALVAGDAVAFSSGQITITLS